MDPTTTAKTYAGVDVSKDRLDVCVWRGEAGRHDDDTFFVPHDDGGIDALVPRQLEERPVVVILEASGGFERAVVAALATAAGLPVAVVNPRQARDFARATGRLAKIDALDAEVLARFAQAIQPAPRPLPDEEFRALQGILVRLRQLDRNAHR